MNTILYPEHTQVSQDIISKHEMYILEEDEHVVSNNLLLVLSHLVPEEVSNNLFTDINTFHAQAFVSGDLMFRINGQTMYPLYFIDDTLIDDDWQEFEDELGEL